MLQRVKDLTNGRKTVIGAVIFFVLYGALGIGIIDQETFSQLAVLAQLVVGVGLTHKFVKKIF